MKKTFLSLFCGLLVSAALFSCVDGNTIGGSMQPDQDKISVYPITVPVQTETILQDSVYLRNSLAVLGEFTDPTYGTIKSDFMAQLYCPFNFKFPDDVSKIDSAYMYLYYNSWFGDSTTVHHLNVWYLDKSPLDAAAPYGSTVNPADYTSKSILIASGTFTTGDFSTSDSAKALSSYSPALRLPLDTAWCKQIFLAENRSNPEKFAKPSAFNNYFNGIYVTTDYGNGSLLYITHSELEMCYNTVLYSNSTGKTARDSSVIGASYFPVNKEVRQINRAEHPDLLSYLNPTTSDLFNYVYAPGGMFTKVSLPDTLFQTGRLLSGKTVNGMKLYVNATQVDDTKDYALAPPASMLLIDASKANAFFSGFELNDGLYSFVADYNPDSLNYVFDLSYYAQKMIRHMTDSTSTDASKAFKPFTEMLLIPVSTVKNADSESVRIEHVISPAAVKIQGGNHPTRPMQLKVIYSKKR